MNKDHYLQKLKERDLEKYNTYSYSLLPETFSETQKIPIQCSLHGVFYQKPHAHLYGNKCPACGRLKTDDRNKIEIANAGKRFLIKARDKFADKFDYSKTIYRGKEVDVVITCPIHSDITISPKLHLMLKEGCSKCGRESSLLTGQNKLLERARRHHAEKYDYSKVNYTKFADTVEIVCPQHGSFWQSLYLHGHNGQECPKCASDKDCFTIDEFICKAKAVHGEEYDYSKVVYTRSVEKVTITCKKHGDFIQRASSHLEGVKCKKCFQEKNRLSQEEFVKQAQSVHGNKYDYSKVFYVQNKKPVEIVCLKHGAFWKKPNAHVSGRAGCVSCLESKGETAVSIFLDKHGINYIREYRIRPHFYRYDFFLPELNIYIEYQGHQHYRPVALFGGRQGFLETKKRDQAKKEIVRLNGGNLITIPFTFLDEKVLEEQLKKRLKRIYSCWLSVDGKLTVYKSVLEVYKRYSVPTNTLVKELSKVLPNYAANTFFLF